MHLSKIYVILDFRKNILVFNKGKAQKPMNYNIDIAKLGRFFSVPCKAIDGHLKKAAGDFFKVLLFILSCETPEISTSDIINGTGVSKDTADNAVLYWNQSNIITITKQQEDSQSFVSSDEINPFKGSLEKSVPVKYDSKEIANIINTNNEIKILFDQLELALGRELRFAERCGYINLYEYYGFSAQSIIILVEYCVSIGKSNIRYIETVAKSLYENGLSEYKDVEKEIKRMSESRTYESKIKAFLGISSNLSTKQRQIVESWHQKNVSEELIKNAYDLTLDNTGKLSFPYMNKILTNWETEGVKNSKDIEEQKSQKYKSKSKDKSYNISDFENYSINFLSDNKEG